MTGYVFWIFFVLIPVITIIVAIIVSAIRRGTYREQRINKHVYTWVGSFLFGGLGVHRFMRGQIVRGVLMIFTLGGLGIWSLVDWIIALVKLGNYGDDFVFINGKWAVIPQAQGAPFVYGDPAMRQPYAAPQAPVFPAMCQNCYNVMLSTAGFCEHCGTPTVGQTPNIPIICKSCGCSLPTSAGFCTNCGTPTAL